MSYFADYVEQVRENKSEALAKAIENTKADFDENVTSQFDYSSLKKVLLYGDVQSGKTTHMLGLMAHAADEGFLTTVILTSDNTHLVQQTFQRVMESFPSFQACQPDDEDRFKILSNPGMSKVPTVIVLNKNAKVLDRWRKALKEEARLTNQPLLVIDDEADAASLNNKVNAGEVTAVNNQLTQIRDQAGSCIYLQVTGTPQSIILQSSWTGWRPDYAFSFEPGEAYVGGRQLFEDLLGNPYVKTIVGDTEPDSRAFADSILMHMVGSAISYLQDVTCRNMLVHPSGFTEIHEQYRQSAERLVGETLGSLDTERTRNAISDVLNDLKRTYPDEFSVSEIQDALKSIARQGLFNFITVNSNSDAKEEDWSSGYNFIFGGNSLGRGLTFDRLQTIFYCRSSKAPQADTLWQHARMFGYARDLETMRIYMPGEIAKLFHEVHLGNEAIKAQIRNAGDFDDISVLLDSKVKPTRPTVIDRGQLQTFVGGVNYFASNPTISDYGQLTTLIERQTQHTCEPMVRLETMKTILKHFRADEGDFPVESFIEALDSAIEADVTASGTLLVRRNRRVRQGTGSLLSETDRLQGANIQSVPVLTLYEVSGDLGWASNPIWVPNIKFPNGQIHYRMR